MGVSTLQFSCFGEQTLKRKLPKIDPCTDEKLWKDFWGAKEDLLRLRRVEIATDTRIEAQQQFFLVSLILYFLYGFAIKSKLCFCAC